MMKIRAEHIIILLPLLLIGCGTIFQGYYYNVKLNIPENTMVFDSNKYEIPIERDITYKTNDTVKYIELRTSEKHELNFVLDSHLKKVSVEPKINYLTFLFDIYPSIFTYGVPLFVDCANRNICKFDDITLKKEDFTQLPEDTDKYIKMNDAAYQVKIISDSIKEYRQGFIFDNTRLSFFVGCGTNSLGWAVFLIPSHGAIGLKCKVINGFDVLLKADYIAFDEEYSAEYSGGVIRYTAESRYYPFYDDGWYLSSGIFYCRTYFEKSFLRKDIIGPVTPNMYGLSVGTGYGGKWWFLEGTYSIGFNKIRLEGIKPFLLSYFSFGIYFNLPI